MFTLIGSILRILVGIAEFEILEKGKLEIWMTEIHLKRSQKAYIASLEIHVEMKCIYVTGDRKATCLSCTWHS